MYEAIRNLSVVKEDPAASTRRTTALAEARLRAAQASRDLGERKHQGQPALLVDRGVRPGGHAWTRPRIYGAGLLSSIRESSHCLTGAVDKVPLSLACVEQDFDITRMQPQLFVARDFEHLFEVLEAFEATLSWKRGGDYGLEEALRARTVNHLVLADGPGGHRPGGALVPARCGRTAGPGWRPGRPGPASPGAALAPGDALARPGPGGLRPVARGAGAVPAWTWPAGSASPGVRAGAAR